MALLRFAFVLTVLLMTTTINVSWFSETHVLASRDIDRDLLGLEKRLLSPFKLMTCGRDCVYNDCKDDCWVCCRCVRSGCVL
ncbi:hypothetical protein A4A49_27980 [Nicotiana attenuata]|uniref:Carboxypeptidase A inhibitor-like domain-containing protein n=1 Tax=Nicotiana attenuata TaxID=49451 RepID=A0A314KST0_NICAT|nr:hypothetical protein A4A49_27980 [Nicotiana attenuata]